MDAATIKGVIDRLTSRGLTRTRSDPDDARRLLVELSETGAELFGRAAPVAAEITERTLAALTTQERERLVELLRRIL